MAKINKDSPLFQAALHLATGALKPGEITPGHHDLSRMEIVLRFPEFAAVDRADGNAGEGNEGFDALDAPLPELSPEAVLLFAYCLIERADDEIDMTQLWVESIRAADAGAKVEAPTAALDALAQVQAELPPAEKVLRRTPSKRTGEKGVEIEMKRLPKKPKAIQAAVNLAKKG
jgi:hypothetical protein